MADLTPDERAALIEIVRKYFACPVLTLNGADIAIWRAARAFENEACAKICETAPDLLQNSTFDGAAAAIRERAKGLTT